MTVPNNLRLLATASLIAAAMVVIPGCAKKAGSAGAPPSYSPNDAMQERPASEAADDGLGYDEEEAGGDAAPAELRPLDELAGGEEGEGPAPDEAGGDLARLDEYERLLAQREGTMRGQGLWLAHLDGPRPSGDGLGPSSQPQPQPFPGASTSTKTKDGKKKKPSKKAGSRPAEPAKRDAAIGGVAVGANCKVICNLKAATCDLEQKICALAERHRDEPRYAEVCGRAQNDCRVATAACDACSDC